MTGVAYPPPTLPTEWTGAQTAHVVLLWVYGILDQIDAQMDEPIFDPDRDIPTMWQLVGVVRLAQVYLDWARRGEPEGVLAPRLRQAIARFPT